LGCKIDQSKGASERHPRSLRSYFLKSQQGDGRRTLHLSEVARNIIEGREDVCFHLQTAVNHLKTSKGKLS